MTATTPKIVELVRVSTVGQEARDTPELQRRALDAMRQRQPGELVARLEATVSGGAALADRPDLQKLAALSAARAFTELRVYAVDRLTRADDPRERFAVWGMAADAGARILDTQGKVIDPADPSGIGELDFYLSTYFAAQERKRIVRRTTDGRHRAASKGRLPHGETPFGLRFDKLTGKWSVDEREAALYRRIFDLYLALPGLRVLADKLAAEGIPTRHGGVWRASTLHRLLRNRAAIGEFTALKTKIQVPAVISREAFDAAQAKMAANKELSGTLPTFPALFRRALVCGDCGRSIRVAVRWRNKARGERKGYYTCGIGDDDRARDDDRHFLFCHRVEDLDAAVRAELERVLSDPKLVTAAAQEVDAAPTRDVAAEVAALRKDARRLEQAEAKTLALLGEEGISADTLKARLKDLATQRSTVASEIAKLEAEQATEAPPPVSLKDVRAAAAKVLRAIKTLSADRWREIVRVLFPDGLQLYADRVEGACILPLAGLVVAGGSTECRAARTKRSS